jgi:hypothetical protein
MVPPTFSEPEMLFSLLLPNVFSSVSCPYNDTLNESLRSWTGSLNGSDCFALTVDAGASLASYSLFAASEEITVQRYTRLGERLEIAESATTPGVSPFDRVFGPSVYVYRPANRSGQFSITFGDIVQHRCNHVIVDNANPQIVELTRDAQNGTMTNFTKTCLVTVVPNVTAQLSIGGLCQECAVVNIYVGWDKNLPTPFANATSSGPIAIVVDAPAPVLVVVLFSELGEGPIDVTGNITSPHWKSIRHVGVEWATEAMLLPPLKTGVSTASGNIYLLIGIGLFGFALQIMTGFVLFKECKKEEQSTAPTPLPTGFTQAIRFVDNNIDD